MDGYEVLLQYDWCGVPMTLDQPAPDRAGEPADVVLERAAVAAPRGRRGRAVRRAWRGCGSSAYWTTVCAVTWRAPRGPGPHGRRGERYGTAAYSIPPGAEATVRVVLSKAGRKALKRKRRLAVDAVVSAGGAPGRCPKLKRKR